MRAGRAGGLALAALLAAPALALGVPTTGNRSGPRFGGWLGIALLAAVLVAAGVLIAWGLHREGGTPRGRLLALMREARALVARPGNRFIRSGWDDAPEALAELDAVIAALMAGRVPGAAISFLLLPTGPLQELSLDSGWGDEFVALAARIDAALAAEARRAGPAADDPRAA